MIFYLKTENDMKENLIIGQTALKQQQKASRELAIYEDYKKAVEAGSYKTDATRSIMEKYGIKSIGTVYIIRKRVEQRLKLEQQH
jgi:hypothetical protein